MEPTVDSRIAEIAARQHGLVSQRQADVAGATRGFVRYRVQVGRWARLHHSVYRLNGSPITWRQELLGAVIAAGEGALAAERAAAALHGLPGYREGPVVVLAHRDRARPVPGAIVRESLCLPEHHTTVVDGIPVTTIARTLFDLAGHVHPGRAERALDNALARQFVTLPSCWRVLDDLAEHGRSGTVLFRELLTVRNGGYVAPASELERRLIDVLVSRGLPMPEREIDLGDRDRWLGRVELVYGDDRLLIEADSRLHHSSFLDQQADRARDNGFMAAGYRVLRFTWDDVVTRPGWVAETVRRARHACGSHGAA
ncbi:MAG: hypothetical protein AMXMBFR46_16700 [Acidimicrobiia bacterium]